MDPKTFFVHVDLDGSYSQYINYIEENGGKVIRMNPCSPDVNRMEIEVEGDLAELSMGLMFKLDPERKFVSAGRASLVRELINI